MLNYFLLAVISVVMIGTVIYLCCAASEPEDNKQAPHVPSPSTSDATPESSFWSIFWYGLAILVILLPIAYHLFIKDWRIEAKVRDAVSASMKDPFSTQFRNIKFNTRSPHIVCGEVNAKNSWGAYVGFTRFIYNSQDGEVVIEPADGIALNADQATLQRLEFSLRYTKACY